MAQQDSGEPSAHCSDQWCPICRIQLELHHDDLVCPLCQVRWQYYSSDAFDRGLTLLPPDEDFGFGIA